MKAFGARPDREHGNPNDDPDFAKLKLVGTTSESVSWRQFIPDIFDQGGSQTCVGQGTAGGWCTQVRAETGEQVEAGSAVAIYQLSIHQYHQDYPKPDVGTYARTASIAVMKQGIPTARSLPFSMENVERAMKKPLPASVLSSGFGWRGPRGHYRIHGTGSGTLDLTKTALQRKRIPLISVSVDDDFTKNAGPEHIRWPPLSRIVGNHLMYVVGYKMVDGQLWFEVVNSWGKGWRNGGMCWLEQGWISQGAFDRWVLDF